MVLLGLDFELVVELVQMIEWLIYVRIFGDVCVLCDWVFENGLGIDCFVVENGLFGWLFYVDNIVDVVIVMQVGGEVLVVLLLLEILCVLWLEGVVIIGKVL